jgi:hypothetical protein
LTLPDLALEAAAGFAQITFSSMMCLEALAGLMVAIQTRVLRFLAVAAAAAILAVAAAAAAAYTLGLLAAAAAAAL